MQGSRAWVNLLTLHFKPRGRTGGGDSRLYSTEGKSQRYKKRRSSIHLYPSDQTGKMSSFGLLGRGSAGIRGRRNSIGKKKVCVCRPLLRWVSFTHPYHSQSQRDIVIVIFLMTVMHSHNERQSGTE